jgi:hypothetical protein
MQHLGVYLAITAKIIAILVMASSIFCNTLYLLLSQNLFLELYNCLVKKDYHFFALFLLNGNRRLAMSIYFPLIYINASNHCTNFILGYRNDDHPWRLYSVKR